ncbi:hypothetical protein MRB53_040287 [Persea americana]|nr:hypothetical protein MRB53_040287 [Persea americana]
MLTWLLGSSTQAPALLRLRSSNTFIIIVVATAIFTDLFSYEVVVPVLPFALTTRANVDPDDVQTWISILLAVYGGGLLVAAPLCGWVADRMENRRVPLFAGLFALTGATVMLCLGRSIAVLVVGRILQGMSAAVVWVVGLALLVDTVGPEDIGAAMGYTGLAMSLAVLVAPLLGGVVFAEAGYYAVFAMTFALIAVDIFFRMVLVEKKRARQWLADSDLAIPLEESTAESVSAANENDHRAISNETSSGDLITTVTIPTSATKSQHHRPASLASSCYHATSPPRPPAPTHTLNSSPLTRLPPVITLFSSRRLLSALWGSVMQASLLTAFDSILPLFVRQTFAWNSIGAGLVFLPMVVASFIGPFVGAGSDKFGARWFVTAGFVLSCPPIILLRLVSHDSLAQKVLLCAMMFFIGVGLTLALTPLMAEISYIVDAKARSKPPGYYGKNGAFAQGYSLFNMAWAAGSLIGPLLGGLVNQSSGWATTTLLLGCLSIATALPAAIWTGGSVFTRRRLRRAARLRDGTSALQDLESPSRL